MKQAIWYIIILSIFSVAIFIASCDRDDPDPGLTRPKGTEPYKLSVTIRHKSNPAAKANGITLQGMGIDENGQDKGPEVGPYHFPNPQFPLVAEMTLYKPPCFYRISLLADMSLNGDVRSHDTVIDICRSKSQKLNIDTYEGVQPGNIEILAPISAAAGVTIPVSCVVHDLKAPDSDEHPVSAQLTEKNGQTVREDGISAGSTVAGSFRDPYPAISSESERLFTCTVSDDRSDPQSVSKSIPRVLATPTPIPDTDGDGILDPDDNCPTIANADQEDTDDDGIGDMCELDSDNDGIQDANDNCPFIANEDQQDSDGNGIGDACEGDSDGDGIMDPNDNCPTVANANQADQDNDGIGDACEFDTDGDGINDVEDNCPLVKNPGQEDIDGNGIGDVCDGDSDGDGILDPNDNCPTIPNTNQSNSDGDDIGDACDNCPSTPNADQADADADGGGDACDNCPSTPNADQADADGVDGGDACDNCPSTPNADQADADADGDGDACDNCPNDPDNDIDGDGHCSDVDICPDISNPLQTPTDDDAGCRFIDNGDGTITDSDTGSIWLQNANCMSTDYPGFDTDNANGDGQVTWSNAMYFVAEINNGNYPNCGRGFTDWHLATRDELVSLIESANYDPALPTGHPFSNADTGGSNLRFWASTEHSDGTRAWVVDYLDGTVALQGKTVDWHVWPVR